jgi:hypothetical protein
MGRVDEIGQGSRVEKLSRTDDSIVMGTLKEKLTMAAPMM